MLRSLAVLCAGLKRFGFGGQVCGISRILIRFAWIAHPLQSRNLLGVAGKTCADSLHFCPAPAAASARLQRRIHLVFFRRIDVSIRPSATCIPYICTSEKLPRLPSGMTRGRGRSDKPDGGANEGKDDEKFEIGDDVHTYLLPNKHE